MKRILFAFVFLLIAANTAVAAGLEFYVLNFRGAKEVERWRPLANYLSEATGKKVKLTGVKLSGMIRRAKKTDFILTNPVIAVKVMDQFDYSAIATQSHKQLGPQFAGVIIVRDDSPIKEITDLAGKKVAAVHLKNAAGGFIFQANELVKAGLDPAKDFKNFLAIQNQNAIVKRVLSGSVDAGFVRTGQLENFVKKGGDIAKIRIINPMTEGLKFTRSTEIFPHWGFLVNDKRIDKGMRDKVQTALLALDKNSDVSKKIRLNGFDEAGDYEKLKNVMKRLNVYDFKK